MAQVRILELEDIRDDAGTRITELDRILAELQTKADQALNDFDHLQGAHREMLAHRDHLQHLLHLSQQSLDEIRGQAQRLAADLAAAAARESDLRVRISDLEKHAADLTAQIARLEDRGRDLERQLTELHAVAATRLDRLNQLDVELRAMKASRSWRWTKPLRAIERFFRRN
jgi:chromosome segregation ATPase